MAALIASAIELGLMSSLSDRDWRTLCALASLLDDGLRWHADYGQLGALLRCDPDQARDRLGDLAEHRLRGEPIIFLLPQSGAAGAGAGTGFPVQLNSNLLDTASDETAFKPIYHYAERLLGRPISNLEYTDIQAWYHQLKLDRNVINELLSECMEKHKKPWSYVRKTAYAWHDSGVRTLEDVFRRREARASELHRLRRVAEYLQIRRPLTVSEQEMVRRWIDEWGFSDEVIKRACDEAAGIPNPMRYIDRTLFDWHEAGVRTVGDAERAAAERAARREIAAARHTAPRTRPAAARGVGRGSHGPSQERLLPKTRTTADDDDWLS